MNVHWDRTVNLVDLSTSPLLSEQTTSLYLQLQVDELCNIQHLERAGGYSPMLKWWYYVLFGMLDIWREILKSTKSSLSDLTLAKHYRRGAYNYQ